MTNISKFLFNVALASYFLLISFIYLMVGRALAGV